MHTITVVITNLDKGYYAQIFMHPDADNEIVLDTACLDSYKSASEWAEKIITEKHGAKIVTKTIKLISTQIVNLYTED